MAKASAKESRNGDVWDKSVDVEESTYYWKDSPVVKRGTHSASTKLTVAEFFCGCGGTSVGFERAGFNVVLGTDIFRPALDTFKMNHPYAGSVLGDIRKIGENQIADALSVGTLDVLIAGVPCQGFSLNNRKRSPGDKRNLLYMEFVRLVKILKPKCIILENVSGMASTGDFRFAIERDLALASGLQVSSKILNAMDYGVPQRRQRLVFVGTRDGFDFDSITATHGPSREKPFNTVRDAIWDLPRLASGEEASSYDSPPKTSYQKLMRAGLKKNQLTNHRAPKHPLETIARISQTQPGEPMYPAFKQRIRLSWDLQSPTQVSGGIRPQFQFGHPEDARGLTIRERCRIQSFPDSFVVCGGIVQGRVQTGNAVPPLLAEAVAKALLQHLN